MLLFGTPHVDHRTEVIDTEITDMQVDHIGVATRDADGLVDTYTGLLNAEVAHRESLNGMDIVFVDVGDGYLELLEPRSEGSIDRYLETDGPGIHHIAFQTANIEADIARAKDLGVNPIDETPRDGAWGHKIAFLHPDSTGGVLIEFVQH
jgi:methylmalonyl-CoA/ethylmalonyl-CoA epimerase